MKTIYSYILLAALLSFSCDRDKLLDLKPFDDIIPSTVEDFRRLLDYHYYYEPEMLSDVGVAHLYSIDLFMTDEYQVLGGAFENQFSTHIRFRDAVTWEKDFGALNTEDFDWAVLYKTILTANVVIEGMNDPKITGDETLKNILKSEAKVHRALAYFSLVNLYSKQYNATSADTDLGVPIKLTSKPEIQIPRASVKKVYDLILNDLKDVIEINALPMGKQKIGTRPSMAAAYAVLAKTHLAMGAYQKALTAANKSLQNYNTLLDMNSIIFYPESINNPEGIVIKKAALEGPRGMYAADDLIALYDPSDLRLEYYMALPEDPNNPYMLQRTNIIEDSWPLSPTTPELYLIRAECNARVGDLNAVDDDLNAIGQNRIPGYTPLPNYTDRATALEAVKIERRKELVGKGVRLFDLKRYNAFDNANISLTRIIDGTTHTLEANSNRWIVPIARSVLAQDPSLEQSPR